MTAAYIPNRDADFANWLQNFTDLLEADPPAYGETVATVAPLVAENAVFQPAYLAAIDPITRTPTTVAAKDSARVTATSTARVVAQRVNANPGVTNEQRAELAITIRKTDRTPIPPPTVAPALSIDSASPGLHVLRALNPSAPDGKAKPFGVTGVELYRAVGDVPAVDPAQASYLLNATRTPTRVSTVGVTVGQQATYFARYTTRSGPEGIAQVGPWSLPLTVGVI